MIDEAAGRRSWTEAIWRRRLMDLLRELSPQAARIATLLRAPRGEGSPWRRGYRRVDCGDYCGLSRVRSTFFRGRRCGLFSFRAPATCCSRSRVNAYKGNARGERGLCVPASPRDRCQFRGGLGAGGKRFGRRIDTPFGARLPAAALPPGRTGQPSTRG